jgi:hypothetical protein
MSSLTISRTVGELQYAHVRPYFWTLLQIAWWNSTCGYQLMFMPINSSLFVFITCP